MAAHQPHIRTMETAVAESLLEFPCAFPLKIMGRTTGRVRPGGARRRVAPRSRFRQRVDGDARVAAGQLSIAHVHGQRVVARATRRAVPRAVSASASRHGAVMAAAPGSAPRAASSPVVRHLGLSDYETTWRAMREFTAARTSDTPDEIWLTEHPPIYTLGLAGRREHLLRDNGIAAIKVDRGGQVTYPRPGSTRRVYAARPGARRARDPRHGTPLRARRDTMARCAGRGGLRETGGAQASTRCSMAADAKIAALGLKVSRGPHLSRPVGQRCHGPCTFLGYRPLRLPRARGDAIARPRRRRAPSIRPAPASRRVARLRHRRARSS